jgi:hypothetical protein
MRRKDLAAGIAALLVVLILAGALSWRWLELTPRVSLPNPKLPSPNTFSQLAAAGAAMSRSNAFADVLVGTLSSGGGGASQAQGPSRTAY